MKLSKLQDEQRAWVEHNFPGRKPYQPLLGAVEELGELAHAHLKMEQGIRGTKAEHLTAAADAVADTVIYLADYCSAMGFDFGKIVEETWEQVKKRDWKKDPKNGVTAAHHKAKCKNPLCQCSHGDNVNTNPVR